jgi:hypothetical protein
MWSARTRRLLIFGVCARVEERVFFFEKKKQKTLFVGFSGALLSPGFYSAFFETGGFRFYCGGAGWVATIACARAG